MTTEDKLERARHQAGSQMSGIAEMVAALECDYDRLEELTDELREAYEGEGNGGDFSTWLANAAADGTHTLQKAAEELKDLQEAASAGDSNYPCKSRDDAYERIQEDPLSVEVRSGWVTPGETMQAEEFTILLCTGGPAVRIVGELDEHREPCRAWMEYQDWFTAWTEYHGDNFDAEVLLTYCQQFYFGE